MSRRIGFLSLAFVVSLGVVAWLIQASALTAQVPGIRPVDVPEPPAAKGIPAPPAFRAQGTFDFHSSTKNEVRIQAAFDDPVTIEFIDTPLKDAMDFIADAHKITILIDEPALTKEGVAIDEPLNRTLSGISLRSALRIMLEPLGLTSVIEDEVLKITSAGVAAAKQTTRVYHTGYLKQIGVEPEDLARTIQNVVEPDQWRPSAAGAEVAAAARNQTVVSRDERGAVGVWDVQNGKPAFRISRAGLQNVQAGGEEGTFPAPSLSAIEVLGDMLVVSAPSSVHEEINRLLTQLDRRWEIEQSRH